VNPSRASANSERYLKVLKDFPSIENGRTNLIFCGHFQELFLSAIRAKPALPEGFFAGFLAVLLNHIEMLSYQGILSVLTVDRGKLFALPLEPHEGYRKSRTQICRRVLTGARHFVMQMTPGDLCSAAPEFPGTRTRGHVTVHFRQRICRADQRRCPTSGVAQRAMREAARHARGVSKARQL
jgi:hypothetical protein